MWVSRAGLRVFGGAAACSTVIPSKLLAPMWEMGTYLFSAPASCLYKFGAPQTEHVEVRATAASFWVLEMTPPGEERLACVLSRADKLSLADKNQTKNPFMSCKCC